MPAASFEALVAVSWVATSIALLFTLGRFYIRARLMKLLRWDDATHLLGLLCLLAQVAAVTADTSMIYEDPDNAIERLTEQNRLKLFLRLDTAAIMLSWCCLYAIKATFLLLYHQIFRVSQGFMRAWWITSIIVFATFWVLFAGTLTKCGSVADLVDIDKCNEPSELRNQSHFVIYTCVLNVLTDVAIMALPLFMLRGLHMNTKAKVGLAGIFGVGIITIAFDLVRSIETLTSGGLGSTALWTNLESAVAVIVSCLPSLKAMMGPTKTGSAAKRTSAYGQRSWPLAEQSKVYRSLGDSSTSKDGTQSSAAAWPLADSIGDAPYKGATPGSTRFDRSSSHYSARGSAVHTNA